MFFPDSAKSGLNVFNGSSWKKYDTSNTAMKSQDILCLAKDSSGAIWVGTRKGVVKWSNDTWTNYCPITNGYEPCGFIRDIKIDSKNRVWVAGFHWGFYLLDQNGTACPNQINISQPASCTIAKTTEKHTILWSISGAMKEVNIEYRKEQGIWNTVSLNTKNGKLYSWAIPTSTPTGKYQIRISSAADPVIFLQLLPIHLICLQYLKPMTV